MIDRLNLKIKSYIHYLTHIGIYFGRNVKIYGKQVYMKIMMHL